MITKSTFCTILFFSVTSAKSADPIITIQLDSSELPWKVEVTNHGSKTLKYETIEGIPIHLGIEHWIGNSGSRLYVGEMAHRQAEMRFAPVYGSIDGGETRVFALDPRAVSSESEEVLEVWKADYKEFKFNEIRIFFEQFASQMFFEPAKPSNKQDGASNLDRAEQK